MATRDGGGNGTYSSKGPVSTIFSEVKKAEPVTSDSYLNDTAGSQAAEVHATVSCSSSEESIFPFTHPYLKCLKNANTSFIS